MTLIQKVDSNINPSDLIKLLSIFKSLKWHINPISDEVEDYEKVFINFCELLSCLNEEEKNIVLTLTEDFLHCPYTIYPTLLKSALHTIPSKIISNCQKVFFLSLVVPDDIGKAKSSTDMVYSCLHTVTPRVEAFSNKLCKGYVNPDLLKEKHSSRSASLIIFLDDFIGSGNTAIKALKYYNSEIRVESDVPIVVSLVAQLEGVIKLNNFGFQVFQTHLRDKCLSDSTRILNKVKAIKIVRSIEKRMNVSKNCRLGYEKSQALVSMKRTPNNTLPIYWWSKKPNGENWNGIFRR